MPIYEYECQACAHHFEEWQKLSDPPVDVCPKCQVNKVQKLISQTSFQLKGGGWYSDLYASNKSASTASGSTSSESKSATPAAATPAAAAPGGSDKAKSGGSSTSTS